MSRMANSRLPSSKLSRGTDDHGLFAELRKSSERSGWYGKLQAPHNRGGWIRPCRLGREGEGPSMAILGLRGHVGESAGGNDGGDGDHGIVAEVKQETGEHRSCPGARESENDANQSQEADQAPGPAQLRAVHEAEQDSGDENSDQGAEADGVKRGGAGVLGEAGNFAGKERIKIAAENSFFDQRSHEDGHGHEQHGAAAALEEFLNGKMIHVLHARAGDRHENG